MKSKKKHWFHGKASNAKKTYIKKHPRSIYAGARSTGTHGEGGAAAYRAQVTHMREEIARMRAQLETIDHDTAQYRSVGIQMRMLQRKLQIFKQHS